LRAMLPASLSARWMPRDFVEVSKTGGAMTLVAYIIMVVLFTCELRSFLTWTVSSDLVLEHPDGPLLQINFDVDMHDIECRNLQVIVVDEMGQSPIRLAEKGYELSVIDRRGRLVNVHSNREGADSDEDEEEQHRLVADRLRKEDGQQELDADWADSHDGFRHQSFEHVIQVHDFTLINFFAEWCVHCRKFAPSWREIADQVKAKEIADRDGKPRQVGVIKVNCVDFEQICKESRISAFPAIRLYKADGTFSTYDEKRSVSGVVAWVERTVHLLGYATKSHPQEVALGCNVRGFLRVPRVPGHLELMAGAGDQNLEPTATNVSHLVKHLSFSDPRDGMKTQKAWPSLPRDALQHVAPLDGRQFCTHAFHEAYEHHLKVVSTITGSGLSYQISHYGRTARLNATVVPQARFHYDLDPFTIMVHTDAKPWYDFGTSLLATLGGIFVLMRLLTMASLAFMTVACQGNRKSRPGI